MSEGAYLGHWNRELKQRQNYHSALQPRRQSENRVYVQEIYQQLSGLVHILIVPLMSVVSALLYLKMRQLGGEILRSALEQIEEVGTERSPWHNACARASPSHPPPTKHHAAAVRAVLAEPSIATTAGSSLMKKGALSLQMLAASTPHLT